MRLALLLALAALHGGCSALGLFGGGAPERDPPAAPVATSGTHYRAFADADALAASLRWRPGVRPLVSAHRGGPGPGLPENALATFEHALNFAPALIECDVRPTLDGRLVLLHDETLDRTTTGAGPLAARTFAEVRRLRLLDPEGRATAARVPTLDEALAWADGRAVLVLDPKPGLDPEALVAAVRQARAGGRVVVIAYTLADLLAFYRLAPEFVYSATATTLEEADALLATPVDPARLIAFAGVGVPDASVVRRLHEAGIRVQAATFGEADSLAALPAPGPAAYRPFLDAGADVLATDHVRAAALAIRPSR